MATLRKKTATKIGFIVNLRSRHPSHDAIRSMFGKLPFRTAVRLGSTWEGDGKPRVECNTVESVKISSNKLLMKRAFNAAGVKTADWWIYNQGMSRFCLNGVNENFIEKQNLPYPIVAKSLFGSRGEGNFLLKTREELEAWMKGKNLSNYIFEKFYNYSREYRLHVTDEGCFYTCRKMLKEETPEDKRWFRNDSNSAWMLESNPLFDKPSNWEEIVAEGVKALEAVGLDIGAIDVRVQSKYSKGDKLREKPEFIILETNSAPSFGTITQEKYLIEIPKILMRKHKAGIIGK